MWDEQTSCTGGWILLYRETAARLQTLFLVHNRMETWKNKKIYLPLGSPQHCLKPVKKKKKTGVGMDAPISYRYGQVPRVLILHLRKACAHTCTSTHLRPRPKSQLVFRFDSVSQEKQEGRLTSAVTAWPCLAAANSFCRAMLTGVGTLIQLQLVDSEGQVCVWALVIQPSLFVARRHRGQARPGQGELQQGEAGSVSTMARHLFLVSIKAGRGVQLLPRSPASSTQCQAEILIFFVCAKRKKSEG
jgi:hypothetical protein